MRIGDTAHRQAAGVAAGASGQAFKGGTTARRPDSAAAEVARKATVHCAARR